MVMTFPERVSSAYSQLLSFVYFSLTRATGSATMDAWGWALSDPLHLLLSFQLWHVSCVPGSILVGFVRKEKVAVRLNLVRSVPRFSCSKVCKSGSSAGHQSWTISRKQMANAETEGGGVCWLLVRPTNKLLKKNTFERCLSDCWWLLGQIYSGMIGIRF